MYNRSVAKLHNPNCGKLTVSQINMVIRADLAILPERQGVISHKRLTLADQKGTVWGSRLQAVLRKQSLSDLSAIASSAELAVKPLLTHMLVHAIPHL